MILLQVCSSRNVAWECSVKVQRILQAVAALSTAGILGGCAAPMPAGSKFNSVVFFVRVDSAVYLYGYTQKDGGFVTAVPINKR